MEILLKKFTYQMLNDLKRLKLTYQPPFQIPHHRKRGRDPEHNGKHGNDSFILTELNNYDKIINYSKTSILSKIDNFKIHQANRISKRGLINEVGYIIKVALTILTIKYNEKILRSRILRLVSSIKDNVTSLNIFFAKDIYNQLIILYNTLLSVLQEIENSVTFCRLSALHPSIIKSEDLFQEIKRISFYYNNELPFQLDHENILSLESMIKVNCKFESTRVIYFLHIPIEYEKDFELYSLRSIPAKHESEYFTIIPNSKFVLKSLSENLITSLSDKCTKNGIYHCEDKTRGIIGTSCEENLLTHQTGAHCQLTKLQIKGNYIYYISKINQFLAICLEQEEIQINCENSIETRKLMGIFLIKKDSCKLYFRKHELSFNEIPRFEIELKKIGPIEPPVHSLIPINEENPVSTTPSWYTVTLYIMIIGAVVLATTNNKYYLKRSRSRKSKPTEDPQPEDEINLPGDASFQGWKSYIEQYFLSKSNNAESKLLKCINYHFLSNIFCSNRNAYVKIINNVKYR
ncbi:hypothetical protein ABEB36_009546 [Hypothenemus hampei]|uniref:Envelope protein n=1 Tax=Hypothenemus hampei TaxID=57062 RepID=A0ABD1EGN8_HYPHA